MAFYSPTPITGYLCMSESFDLKSPFSPAGDQPRAIAKLSGALKDPGARRVLLGVTGSGKTFTLAHVVQELQIPALVMAPNKTLASQLYQELSALFPDNAVEYFVSYYDYFQPEAYIASSDTYIEKDSRVNDRIDRMRNKATASLQARSDVIVVASISCIYGLGDPSAYRDLSVVLKSEQNLRRLDLLGDLIRARYVRTENNFEPGAFRVRGRAVEIWPVHEQDRIYRIEIEQKGGPHLSVFDPLTGEIIQEPDELCVFPAGHFVQPEDKVQLAIEGIRSELLERESILRRQGKNLEAERLVNRVAADLEDLKELGFCSGIENYSRHLEGREAGQPPFTLLHYFPSDFLCVLDESHVTLPQVNGMARGDRSRKESLVEHGFRLPSAVDNRPLKRGEFESLLGRVLYLSATPGQEEKEISGAACVEQVVRPTGLLDPVCEILPVTGQVEASLKECKERIENGDRVLVTVLTKRSAEDLTEFLQESGIRARYLHADVDTLERSELLRDLRLGVFDVLVGINLLREGLDLPEVSLVLVLDADKEGFLRSETALVQICGRAARNVNGKVILFADSATRSIRAAMEESARRRTIQEAFNQKAGQTPQSISKPVAQSLTGMLLDGEEEGAAESLPTNSIEIEQAIEEAHRKMLECAAELNFEGAVEFRNRKRRLESLALEVAE